MYPAVAAAVWYAGWRVAVLATVLGCAAIDYFFMPPLLALWIKDPLQWHELATFCAGAFIIILFGELMRRALTRARCRMEEFETLIETAPVGIIVATDRSCKTMWGNSTMRQLLGTGIQSRWINVAESGTKQFEQSFRRGGTTVEPHRLPTKVACQENRTVKNAELDVLRPDGQLLSLICSATPLPDSQGEARGCIAAFLDVTELRRAEKALKEAKDQLAAANQELEKRVQERTLKLQEALMDLEAFSYSIAHDMRAPLRSMSSFADLLKAGWSEKLDSEAKDYLERISRSASRLDALILDVLNYSHVVQQEWPLQPVDVHALVQDILKSYPEFQSPGALVRVIGHLPWVLGNVAALTQCVSNIVENGIKFAKPGTVPEIIIRPESLGPTVRLWFEDNGIGVPPAWHERIFHLLQQYHASGQYEGTGIGLAIVRKSVERMGGRVGVESEVGKGSRFWIDLHSPSA
jgi:signal transduction histidine kinase